MKVLQNSFECPFVENKIEGDLDPLEYCTQFDMDCPYHDVFIDKGYIPSVCTKYSNLEKYSQQGCVKGEITMSQVKENTVACPRCGNEKLEVCLVYGSTGCFCNKCDVYFQIGEGKKHKKKDCEV